MTLSPAQRQSLFAQARRLLTHFTDRGEAQRLKGLIDIMESDSKRIDDLEAAVIRMNGQLVKAGILVETTP